MVDIAASVAPLLLLIMLATASSFSLSAVFRSGRNHQKAGLLRRFLSRQPQFEKMAVNQTVLICGPSGVGKGTLISRLLSEYNSSIALSVSRTSRKPRVGEIEGVHYYFTTREELEKDVQSGSFAYLEYTEVHGNLYGTREDAVYEIHKQGKVCLLDLDTMGAKKLKDMRFPMRSIFIAPPSLEQLELRLRGRGTETEAQRQLRLENAKQELVYGTTPGHFDCILVNDDLDRAYQELTSLLQHWFPSYFPTRR